MARVVFNQPISLYKGTVLAVGYEWNGFKIVSNFDHPETKILENVDVKCYRKEGDFIVELSKIEKEEPSRDTPIGIYFYKDCQYFDGRFTRDLIIDRETVGSYDWRTATLAVCKPGAIIIRAEQFYTKYVSVFDGTYWMTYKEDSELIERAVTGDLRALYVCEKIGRNEYIKML